MKLRNVSLITALTLASSVAQAGQCVYRYDDLQHLLRDGVTPLARDNMSRGNALFQEAANLERAVSSPGVSAQFEQSVNAQLDQAATANQHSREALYNVRQLLTADFDRAYQNAVQVICGGQ